MVNPPTRTIRIVLADDHSLIREGTRHILSQFPDLLCLGEAGDGLTAVDLIKQHQPDIAIVDIRMPGLNGIEIVQRMRELSPNTKALVLTAYDDDNYILSMLEAGASGYLLKTIRASDLAATVRRVHEGDTVLDPVVINKVAHFWAGQHATRQKGAPRSLTTREHEVLKLAAGCLRNNEIAERLSISIRTVEGHFRNIYDKLEVSSRLEAVLYVLSHNMAELRDS